MPWEFPHVESIGRGELRLVHADRALIAALEERGFLVRRGSRHPGRRQRGTFVRFEPADQRVYDASRPGGYADLPELARLVRFLAQHGVVFTDDLRADATPSGYLRFLQERGELRAPYREIAAGADEPVSVDPASPWDRSGRSPRRLAVAFCETVGPTLRDVERCHGLETGISISNGSREVSLDALGREYFWIRYTLRSKDLRIEVSYGDREFDLGVVLAWRGGRARRLSQWAQALGLEHPLPGTGAWLTTEDLLSEALEQAAARLGQIVPRVLTEGPRLVRRIRESERRAREEHDRREDDRRRSQAAVRAAGAHAAGEYETVVELLRPFDGCLAPPDAWRLEHAKRHAAAPDLDDRAPQAGADRSAPGEAAPRPAGARSVRGRARLKVCAGATGWLLGGAAFHLVTESGWQPKGRLPHLLLIVLALPGAFALAGGLELLTGRPFAELSRAWDELAAWQRAGVATLSAVAALALLFLGIALLLGG